MSEDSVQGLSPWINSPRIIIKTSRPLTMDQKQKLDSIWDEAMKTGRPLFLGPEFRVFALNQNGGYDELGADVAKVLPLLSAVDGFNARSA